MAYLCPYSTHSTSIVTRPPFFVSGSSSFWKFTSTLTTNKTLANFSAPLSKNHRLVGYVPYFLHNSITSLFILKSENIQSIFQGEYVNFVMLQLPYWIQYSLHSEKWKLYTSQFFFSKVNSNDVSSSHELMTHLLK